MSTHLSLCHWEHRCSGQPWCHEGAQYPKEILCEVPGQRALLCVGVWSKGQENV